MRRFTFSALVSAISLVGIVSSLQANEVIQYVINVTGEGYSERTLELFKQTSSSSDSSHTLTKISTTPLGGTTPESTYFNPTENKIYVIDENNNKLHSYDITNDSWTRDISLTTGSLDSSPAYATVNIQSSAVTTNTSNITTNRNNINNLGEGVANATALTAALTALPQASNDSKISCGVGTGTYSSSYALGLGCASKVNERVDVNFGGSYVGGGSKDYGSGSLDNVAAKAGFVFKLGKIVKPVQLSMSNKNSIQEKTLLSIQKENEEIKKVNSELIDRLEKLEVVLAKLKEALTF